MAQPPGEVSQLLVAWNKGDGAALNRLMPLVYEELRRMARRHMGRQQPAGTLQTTALINQAYVQLVGRTAKKWQNRMKFFSLAAQPIRNTLLNSPRSRQSP